MFKINGITLETKSYENRIFVETQFVRFDKLVLESGEIIEPVTAAYETYGLLNKQKDNAILILHAFSGDSHAAFFKANERKPGWWDILIGPGKAFDTDKYFIISSNVLGGCKGTTGPASINPKTGMIYGLDFPLITLTDMVNLQKMLIDYFGIKKLYCIAGGSMGGMQVLEWIKLYPEMVQRAIPIATTMKHTPMQIAFNEAGRQAIMADPNWNEGHYYESEKPNKGLSVARMIGHITYMSDNSMKTKFGRKFRDAEKSFKFGQDFEVEGYLSYQGSSFVERFDANSYLYISKAIDYFDLTGVSQGNNIYKNVKTKFLVISFTSDWLYPPYQSEEIVNFLHSKNIPVKYEKIDYEYGHDSFLIEKVQQTEIIRDFLNG